MKDKKPQPKLSHPLEVYLEQLTAIKGVGLTQREVDVISCLLHMGARSRKYIADLLFIDFKTVNLHVSKAANKLIGYCNVDRMMAFLESSDQVYPLKTYYLTLLTDNLFKKTLKEEIKPLIHKNVPLNCVMVYWQKKPPFLENLKKDLICTGLEVSVESRKEAPSFNELIEENYHDTYPIYFFPNTLMERQETQPNIQGANHFSHTKIFFLPKIKSPMAIPQEFSQFTFINPSEWSSYYFSVFVILKKLISSLDLNEIFAKFEEKAGSLHSSPFPLLSHPLAREIPEEEDERKNYAFQLGKILVSKRLSYVVAGILSVGVFFLWVLNKKSHEEKEKLVSSQNYSIGLSNLVGLSIRSDLTIPAKPTLLNRSNLIAQIDRHFQKQSQDIQTIALVGIGGAGKTTLARQYARSQNSPVVWEINAETKNSIRSSFEGLAYALSKTDEEKKALRDLQNINDVTERDRKIIQLVKDHLRSCPNWLLIYDNVEEFGDIQKYFPSDPKAWGVGRILITTNDANIQNNRLINQILPIKELDEEEKLQLFMNIMHTGNGPLFSLAQKEQAQQFLSFIPSYPLDISIAAYYLKTTQISYEKYLRYMEAYNTSFEAGVTAK